MAEDNGNCGRRGVEEEEEWSDPTDKITTWQPSVKEVTSNESAALNINVLQKCIISNMMMD